jgi:DUF1680 family protein
MLLLGGAAKYADVMERVLYNSALSPMSIDGTRFCYANPLARHRSVPRGRHDTLERWSVFTCYCCPPSVARTLAKTNSWAYSLSDGAVWVHLYGSSVLQTKLPGGGEVRVVQKTDYPWDGRVTIKVEEAPSGLSVLKVRIPAWADRATLSVNGTAFEGAMDPGTYAEIRRTWSNGDVVELELPLEVALWDAHPRVEEARNRVAIMRGPIVYCLESADLPEGVNIDDVRLPRDAKWTTNHAPGLLGGVTVLETTAHVRSGGPWTGLYRRLPKQPPRNVPLRLVPYYAWNNRGPGEMTVWLSID